MAAHLHNLNDAQHRAVTFSPMASCQILAGPGSGKTRTLTSRVAHLVLEHNIKAKDLVVVTFTNKAANEMRQRLKLMLGDTATAQLVMGTFHSVSVRYLRRHGPLIEIPHNFLICDHTDSVNLIKRLTNEAKEQFTIASIEPPKPKAVQEWISKAKAKGLTPEAYRNQAENQNNEMNIIVSDIYLDYQTQLRKDNALDFDDLLIKGLELFQQHQNILANIKHVLVDEFQDTNNVQYELVKFMAKKCQALTSVGDPDQSIYGWRSAEVENIEHMLKDFKPCTQIYLEENYRSTGAILAASLAVVSQDTKRIQKKLYTSHSAGLGVVLRQLPSPQMEGAYIAAEIKRLIAHTGGQLKYDDFVILLRYNSLSRAIEGAFQTAGIPNRILGGSKFFDRVEVKDILSYLQLIESPGYSMAFERVVNVPKRAIGAQTISKIQTAADSKQISMMEVVTRSLRGSSLGDLKPAQKKVLKPFLAVVARAKDLATKGATVPELIDFICQKIEYASYLERTYGPTDKDARMQNVEELKSYAAQVAKDAANQNDQDDPESSQPTVNAETSSKIELTSDDEESDSGFEETLSLLEASASQTVFTTPLQTFLAATQLSTDVLIDEEDGQENKPKVTISTIHSAKGLEWPVVFAPACEDGILPFFKCDTPEQQDEERRLLYVAMTRAQVALYLTHVRARMAGAEVKQAKMSAFLQQLSTQSRDLVVNQPDKISDTTRNLINTVVSRPQIEASIIQEAIATHAKTVPSEASWDAVVPEASTGRYGGLSYNGYQTGRAPPPLPQTNMSYSASSSQAGPSYSQSNYRSYTTSSQVPQRMGSIPNQPASGFGKASALLPPTNATGFSSAKSLVSSSQGPGGLGSGSSQPNGMNRFQLAGAETRLSRIPNATLLNPGAPTSANPSQPTLSSFQSTADDSISFLKALAKEESEEIFDWKPSSSESPDKKPAKPASRKRTAAPAKQPSKRAKRK